MNTALAVISGEIFFPNPTPKVIDRVRKATSFANPEYFKLNAAGFTGARYSDDIPEKLYFSTETPEGIRVPRGSIRDVRDALAQIDVKPEFADRRNAGEAISIPHDVPLTLRPFQVEVRTQLVKRKQGLAIVGAGGGKTITTMACMYAIKRKTLILVHTGDLLEQWVEELDEKLGLKAGTIVSGKFKPGAEVTVAMIQTLAARANDLQLQAFFDSIGFVVLDEAHHAPAATFIAVLARMGAMYRLGLTATPQRADGCGRVVDWCFGDRLIEMPTKALLEQGYLMSPELEIVPTEFTFESKEEHPYKRAHLLNASLAGDEPRQHLIASVMAHHGKAGESCLILANRREYARELGRLLWTHGVEAVVVTGDTAKGQRREAMKRFRMGTVRVLVATSLANEGLNAPQLSRIAFAWPEKSDGGTDQKTSRVMRIYDKKPKLIDFVDVRVPDLMRRYEGRARVYRRLGMNPPKPKDLITW